ncbi:hypothetical protein DFS34DRAFT_615140, partial [Phlyctochytrium arcticum]
MDILEYFCFPFLVRFAILCPYFVSLVNFCFCYCFVARFCFTPYFIHYFPINTLVVVG